MSGAVALTRLGTPAIMGARREEMRPMKRWMRAVAVMGVALMLAEVGPVSSWAASSGSRSTHGRIGTRARSSYYRGRRSSRTRRTSRPVVRRVGVTLPQLRNELSRLETGLGAHVQRLEKAAVRPPPRPVVVKAPLAPAPPPALPVVPLILAATLGAAAAGALGFGLGRWSARPHPASGTPAAAEGAAGGEVPEPAAAAQRWTRLHRELDEAQQGLDAARSRLRRLERGT